MHDYQINVTKLNSCIIYWQYLKTFGVIESDEPVQNVKLV